MPPYLGTSNTEHLSPLQAQYTVGLIRIHSCYDRKIENASHLVTYVLLTLVYSPMLFNQATMWSAPADMIRTIDKSCNSRQIHWDSLVTNSLQLKHVVILLRET